MALALAGTALGQTTEPLPMPLPGPPIIVQAGSPTWPLLVGGAIGAFVGFSLNVVVGLIASTRARWNVARAVLAEIEAAGPLLPQLAANLRAVAATRVVTGPPFFFENDEEQGSVFRVFGDDLKHLPPRPARSALKYFEHHRYVSGQLTKIEGKAFFEGYADPGQRRDIVALVADELDNVGRMAVEAAADLRRYLNRRWLPW